MLGWRPEINYKGIVYKDVKYDTAVHAESARLISLHVGPPSAVLKGFLSATGPKGKDGFHHESKSDVLTRMTLQSDVGALAGHSHAIYIGRAPNTGTTCSASRPHEVSARAARRLCWSRNFICK